MKGKLKLDYVFIKKSFENEKYELTSQEYVNALEKLNCICPNGHVWSVRWNDWQQGIRCPKCSNNVSKWEKDVKKFFDVLGIIYSANDRTQLINPKTNCPLELDIWFPQLNKAIECNGLYWHKDKQDIDLLKQQLCKQQGISLLVITDKEWNGDVDKCKGKIKKFIFKKESIKW